MGDWNQPVGQNGRTWFEEQLRQHTKVRRFRAEGQQVYVVERRDLSDVRVWLCDPYTLGLEEYDAIRAADPGVNAIVVLSVWNQYSPQAKTQGKADDVGVFRPGEFLSALHREGDAFLDQPDA